MSRLILRAAMIAALLVSTRSASAQQTCPATQPGATMPLTYKGGPTVTAITPCDLMTRLYLYAADSMRGREAGSPDAIRATAYIEREVRRLGLVPAGDPAGDGPGYFQALPVTARFVDPTSTITVGASTFHVNSDFIVPNSADRTVTGDVIFGGTADSVATLSPESVQGKIVIVAPGAAAAGGRGQGGGGFGRGGGGATGALAGAAAVLTISQNIVAGRPQYILNDTLQSEGQAAYRAAQPANANAGGRGGAGGGRGRGAGGPMALSGSVTPAVAAALLGKPVANAVRGDRGASATISVRVRNDPSPTRNVVAILRGSDPVLSKQYIVIGAHSDHVAPSAPVEHDSLKAYNIVARTEGAESSGRHTPTDADWVRINAIKDSLRKIYPARMDSINNGADDDGTGSVSILEIAEAFAKGNVKPKRSLIFIWQMGEEKGLWGSQWYTNHPTVPRDSIVADLNLDMVGRGAPSDVTGDDKDGKEIFGALNYVQLVGAGRLSSELGAIAEEVNKALKAPFTLDYAIDANGHPMNIYCRSDHANYARYNIPVIFFTTGGHADYHQQTDEPQYIRYEHMSRVDQYVFDIAVKVGNLDHPVVVDKTKADSPFARCQQ